MAWMRVTAGYLGTSYRYSKDVVYNNFPWCEPTPEQKQLIEESAQKILDVRASFQGNSRQGNREIATATATADSLVPYFPNSLPWTLAKLYNEETMPAALRSAHKWNDYNVALAYGMEEYLEDEGKIVAELMRRYDKLANGR